MRAKYTETVAGRIVAWLKGNGLDISGMTHHDCACLRAAAEVGAVWVRGDADNKKLSAQAFGRIVAQVQPQYWGVLFHVVALSGDWSHRLELWSMAGLPAINYPGCAFEPGGSGWRKWKEDFQRDHPEAAEAARKRAEAKAKQVGEPGPVSSEAGQGESAKYPLSQPGPAGTEPGYDGQKGGS